MTATAARLPFRIPRTGRVFIGLIVFWTLSMIALPILRWVFGDEILTGGVIATVLLQVAVVAAVLVRGWGFRRTVVVVGSVLVMTWAVEFMGSATGFPFGEYDYTDRLQPQVLGVPLLIPLAWLMMLPCAWAVASCIVAPRRRAAFALVTALAFTAWDLFLDPQMVSWGMWAWADPVGYFGIPWVNYAGWILSSMVITFVVRPSALPVLPLFFIYVVTWLFMTIGLAVFWGMPGPALTGFVVMGLFVLLAARSLRNKGRL